MMEEENYIILDVRTVSVFDEKHIPGADAIPELPDKDQLILVYSRSGNRSKKASEKLAKLGYTNVHNIGGIAAYQGKVESL